jgi:hypothetical protein
VKTQRSARRWRDRLLQQEDLNFLLTNRVPRIALTRFMGWFSQIRQPWCAICRSRCGGSLPTSTWAMRRSRPASTACTTASSAS